MNKLVLLYVILLCGISSLKAMEAPPLARQEANEQNVEITAPLQSGQAPTTITAELRAAAEAGQAREQFKVGFCYEAGLGVVRSLAAAREWYQKSAAQGYSDAQYHLARICEHNKEYQVAFEMYKKAAAQDNIFAQFKLAQMYEQDGPEKSLEQAEKLYKKIVNEGVVLRPDADASYKKAASHVRAQAAYMMGQKYERGEYGIVLSFVAGNYYETALRLDPEYDKAMLNLALLCIRGEGVPKNPERGRRLLLKAAERGHKDAECQLGNIARDAKDYKEARKRYQNALPFGNAEAHFNMGQLFEEGLGGEKNLAQALFHYNAAAILKYVPALERLGNLARENGVAACFLGHLHEFGLGVIKNDSFACDWYRIALLLKEPRAIEYLKKFADTNNAEAQYTCGKLCLSVNPALPIYFQGHESALMWFYRAARSRHYFAIEGMKALAQNSIVSAVAARYLGTMFLKGEGVERNARTAVEWLTRAAELNDEQAQFSLAECYAHADGVTRDLNRAIGLYGRSAEKFESAREVLLRIAERDDTEGRVAHVIGQLFESGKGFKKSYADALQWYVKSAEKNNVNGAFDCARLLENASQEEIRNAEDVLKTYRKALEWYKTALKLKHAEAFDNVERVTALLYALTRVRVPDFRNFLFLKLRLELARRDVSPCMLYWFAHICGIVRNRCSEVIQEIVYHALMQLADFPKNSKQSRAVVQVMIQLVESEDFSAAALNDKEEILRITELGRICHGISLISKCTGLECEAGKKVLKRVDDSVRDIRIEVFNCLFRMAQKSSDDAIYRAAVNTILQLYDQAVRNRLITDDLLNDDEYLETGTRATLERLLTCHNTDRFKNRIIQITHLLQIKLDERTRAAQLASWAVAGLHCNTRGEEETYNFYILNSMDARSLDENDPGLEMRFALCLAELRKQCLSALVPEHAYENIHQVAYLEKKVGRLLALVGDAEQFSDDYSHIVVEDDYKNMSVDEIMTEVLDRYTADAMINFIVAEANKLPKDSRLPYNRILEYFETVLHDRAAELLRPLYDIDGLLTREGAKILLHHFGYLE